MFDLIGKPLFSALAAAATDALGAGHACTAALGRAGQTGMPADIAAAEAALKQLAEPLRTQLMGAAHQRLRENPGSLLAAMGPAERGHLH
ncbi:hypothetical protein [Ancylobacter amanitiformis]|uniref:Uncharacterized protein n=1 Tax=Ancylobacter amanitiformis TaxID=217069 RepID=A0ABU0LMG6_9HYPH|nr:hypothetical protein [Ancylobacter amanitiformis]MDQ0509902.1 hypothetical protein [Ancylobacter amanitiformis]